jgi:hypothetical protein
VESEVEGEADGGTARKMVLGFLADCFLYDEKTLLCGRLSALAWDALGIMTVGLELCEARGFSQGGVLAWVWEGTWKL